MPHVLGWLVVLGSTMVASCGGTSTSTGSNTGDGSTCAPGGEACACLGDGSCNAGLDCRSNLCVNLGAGGRGGGSGGTDEAGTTTDGAADVGLDGTTVADRVILTDGPPGDHCYGRDIAATGSPGLVDDFEDGNVALMPNDSRSGSWTLVGDTGCKLTPTPLLPETPVAGTTVNDASKYALHVTGSGCTSFGFNAILPLNLYAGTAAGDWGYCAYDVTAYDGVYFWAYGDGTQLWVQVPMRTTLPMSIGGDGSCAQDGVSKGCYDNYGTFVDLTADWKLYSVSWADLISGGWGTPTPFDRKLVVELQFTVTADQTTSTPASFWLDNVGFYKGTPPTAPP